MLRNFSTLAVPGQPIDRGWPYFLMHPRPLSGKYRIATDSEPTSHQIIQHLGYCLRRMLIGYVRYSADGPVLTITPASGPERHLTCHEARAFLTVLRQPVDDSGISSSGTFRACTPCPERYYSLPRIFIFLPPGSRLALTAT